MGTEIRCRNCGGVLEPDEVENYGNTCGGCQELLDLIENLE